MLPSVLDVNKEVVPGLNVWKNNGLLSFVASISVCAMLVGTVGIVGAGAVLAATAAYIGGAGGRCSSIL